MLLLLCVARQAEAQHTTQLWGEFKLSWIETRQLTYGLDVEPKLLLSKPESHPDWVTLDLTPSVEYSRGEWLDVVGELLPDHEVCNETTVAVLAPAGDPEDIS